MEDIHGIDRLARTGANENCSLTLEEVRARSPDLTKLAHLQVDKETVIFYDPAKKTTEQIRNDYSNYKKNRYRLWENESDI